MAAEWTLPVAVSLSIGMPLIIYTLVSLFFFYQPHILHRVKRIQSFKARSISHSGGAGEKLEGTMAAFTNAVERGTDALEMDVRLTSDDVVVVFHDETLEKTCGVPKAVRDVKYEELPLLKPRLNLYYRKDHWTEGADRRIVTLREVFEKFTDTPMIIEAKGTESVLIKKVADLIKEFERENKTVWGSFSDETTSLMFKMNPKIPLYFSYKRGIILLIYYYTGLLPFVGLKESILLAPMSATELDPENGFQLGQWQRIKTWLMDKIFMRPSLFWHLSERAIDTYLFALNKDSEYERAFKQLKAAGVVTDFPSVLSDYLGRIKYTTESDNLLKTVKHPSYAPEVRLTKRQ